MKLSAGERLLVADALRRADALWESGKSNHRARFIHMVSMVEALVEHVAKNHGRRQTWEWLHRIADQLQKEELH